MKQRIAPIIVLVLFVLYAGPSETRMRPSSDGSMGLGLPLGASSEPSGLEKCPQGVRVVHDFLNAWRREDWQGMYLLLDPSVREEYSLQQAEFDFPYIQYREYKISSVKKSGENYEFLLSAGDWQYGDKITRTMVISGQSNKILMPSSYSFFKRSILGDF